MHLQVYTKTNARSPQVHMCTTLVCVQGALEMPHALVSPSYSWVSQP